MFPKLQISQLNGFPGPNSKCIEGWTYRSGVSDSVNDGGGARATCCKIAAASPLKWDRQSIVTTATGDECSVSLLCSSV